jgi:DNA repair protein RecN (Recombination protein N)
LAMQPGEWEAVQSQHKRLTNSSALLSGAQGLIGGLEEGDDALVPRLAALAAKARALAEMDGALKEVADALQPAAISAEEAARSLSRYLGRADADPARLGEVEARMGAIHGMARKFRLTPAELPEKRMEWQSRLDELDAAGDAVALEKREAEAQASYRASAKTLSAARKKAAKKLAQEVTQAMQTLAMDGGKFDIALEPLEGGSAAGDERVEFLVAGHAGTTPRPIAKVASGGELARIGLAIQVIAAQGTAVPTLIFDEVDSGIGGRVAEVVGRLLAQLGEHRQVLAVTHLPQVAACGAQHFTVAKTSSKQGTTSSVRALSKAERVDEVARMLGGIEVTAATKKAAKEMLQ